MASKQTERYVRYYTFGSAAPKLEQPKPKTSLPRMKRPIKRKPIAVDPVAFMGSTVAVVLAILMIVGLFQVAAVSAQVRRAEQEILALEMEREMLEEIYESGYDLDEIRAAAESMGMIPVEEATHVQVQVAPVTPEVVRLSWWDSLLVSLRQFLA